MKAGFEPGIVRELMFVVTEEMCPAFDGAVVHRCCSTWTVAHQFELAARMVLAAYLEDHEEGIGSHVTVDHKAPCPLGRTVRVRAELTEVSGGRPRRAGGSASRQAGSAGHHPRVTCDVSAYDGDRLLATGKQVQVVMRKDHLKEYIERS